VSNYRQKIVLKLKFRLCVSSHVSLLLNFYVKAARYINYEFSFVYSRILPFEDLLSVVQIFLAQIRSQDLIDVTLHPVLGHY